MAWTDRVKLSMLKFYHTVGCTLIWLGQTGKVKYSKVLSYCGMYSYGLDRQGKVKYAKVLSNCGMYTHMAWTDKVKLSTLKFYHTVGCTLIWLGRTR